MNLSELMNDYFDEVSPKRVKTSILAEIKLPVKIDDSKWNIRNDPERFIKVFKFDKNEHIPFFVQEILKYESKYNHHGKIIIEGNLVKIEINTKTVEKITELDQEYTEHVEDIYEDILNFERRKRNTENSQ